MLWDKNAVATARPVQFILCLQNISYSNMIISNNTVLLMLKAEIQQFISKDKLIFFIKLLN
jgi:hypothetical protein